MTKVKVDKVVKEFELAAIRMADVGACVSVYGSARTPVDHPHYQDAVRIAKGLAEAGYGVITGGGQGIMQAGNEGAAKGGGESVGLSIFLPFETVSNDYVNNQVDFNYFFSRKVIFVNYSSAFVLCPGGAGSQDEFWECITLMQTGKIKKRPFVVFNSEYHAKMLEYLDFMIEQGTMSPEDRDLFVVIDDPDEVVEYLKSTIKEN